VWTASNAKMENKSLHPTRHHRINELIVRFHHTPRHLSDTDREELREQLSAMVAGRGDGIDLDTPFHWVIEDLKRPVPFFEQLPELLPPDSILYVEGTSITADAAAFYSSHRASNAVDVVRDTIAPVPDIYHFTFSPEVSASLRQFAESRPVAELFDHIKAYRARSMLFTFHDAFDGWLRISEHVPQERVGRFTQALGVSSRREATKQRNPEQLRQLLWLMENPHKIRFAGESRWRRLWRQWTGR
jgi:hypothetical protein